MERTFVMLKPDAIKKDVAGEVISRLEKAGLEIIGMKMIKLDEKICREHYAHHVDKPFFKGLVEFMCSTPVICMVLEGENAVEVVRSLAGPTDSKKAPKGTIRGDFGTDVQANIIHASDSRETAESEIKRFFKKSELFSQ
ncbi:MAG: Nucleoside diphosphate kinase [Candidatus Fermentimicrarchaeum limneticum]|jgi:nucleoside-diphosphate kinase|uniref:Nucleoside diphosphate kinase n=1 Tax=Fermentimicrarchaeum limneticum TaxID=2795018 RepID=A0A7D6BL03_FERL1|nr:MAG: Nucleoside diphosphate kinase [Candidatus Fermentimicrarchaeum limneticum]